MEANLGHWVLSEGLKLPDNFIDSPPLGFVYKITNKESNKI